MKPVEIKVNRTFAVSIILQAQGINVPAAALVEIWRYVDKSNSIVLFGKLVKQNIAGHLHIGVDMLNKYIKKLVDCGLLVPVKECRGTYIYTPTEELQGILCDNIETDWTIKFARAKKNRNCDGQMSIADLKAQ